MAHGFLSWFRAVRLQQKDHLRRHRFIVGGSIGIDPILRRLSASEALNDFERVYVEPLAYCDAERLINDLAASLEIDCNVSVCRAILTLIGPAVPYFIHLFFSQLALAPASDRQPLTMKTLDRVYNQRILGPTSKLF